MPAAALNPWILGRVWFFHVSSGTAPEATSAPKASMARSHSLSCSSCSRTTRRVDWVLNEEGTFRMAALTSSSIFESGTGLFLPSL